MDVREGARSLLGKARRARSLFKSHILRLILASNMAGLIILVSGALVVNEVRAGLVRARMDTLQSMATGYESVISLLATSGDPAPGLDLPVARAMLKRLQVPDNTRVRLYAVDRELVADTFLLTDQVQGSALGPLAQPNFLDRWALGISRALGGGGETGLAQHPSAGVLDARSLNEELSIALTGEIAASQRFSESGDRLISVSVPIQHVSAVVGVLTVEASDVQDIIRAERAALAPIIGVAVLVSLITSGLLAVGIARPLRRLSLAADRVRAGQSDRLDMPQLSGRKDEIGDLAKALEAMTAALRDRIELNERFAADVAHELKNPLTSIRSAVETAQAVKDPEVQERMRDVIARDVVRLDRLITDISNASRLEAEIAREKSGPVDMRRLLEDLTAIWSDTRRDHEPQVTLTVHGGADDFFVTGRELPLSQVIRNLVENARSFSSPGGGVRISLTREEASIRIEIDDDGPGLPDDKLEKVFERFYSDRPKGATFGNNSGLGLSIVRQIVETHHGAVWAGNRKDGDRVLGARFTVRLPIPSAKLKSPT